MLFEVKRKMKKFLQNVSCAFSCLKKEEFSQNKEGNIKTLTNSQRVKNSDIYSKKGHPPCHHSAHCWVISSKLSHITRELQIKQHPQVIELARNKIEFCTVLYSFLLFSTVLN